MSAPDLGHMYLHKDTQEEFPGRAVVSQLDDQAYKICKILTNILNHSQLMDSPLLNILTI